MTSTAYRSIFRGKKKPEHKCSLNRRRSSFSVRQSVMLVEEVPKTTNSNSTGRVYFLSSINLSATRSRILAVQAAR